MGRGALDNSTQVTETGAYALHGKYETLCIVLGAELVD